MIAVCMKCKSSSDGEGWILEDSGGDDGYFEIGQETCGSEHARDASPGTTGIQTSRFIVNDHREHARSYRICVRRQTCRNEHEHTDRTNKNPTKISESVTLFDCFDDAYSLAVALFGDLGLAT
ncbi:hypothetical protein D3C73_1120510 [compost metagenome]